MTLDHAPTAYTHPAQWADDWLTPTERRALRATESTPASYTPQRAQNALSQAHSAAPTPQRSTLSRIVQRIAQAVAYSAIALCIVGLWYIGCQISWILSAH